MKNIYDVLTVKEAELARLIKEIEAFKIVISCMEVPPSPPSPEEKGIVKKWP